MAPCEGQHVTSGASQGPLGGCLLGVVGGVGVTALGSPVLRGPTAVCRKQGSVPGAWFNGHSVNVHRVEGRMLDPGFPPLSLCPHL